MATALGPGPWRSVRFQHARHHALDGVAGHVLEALDAVIVRHAESVNG